MSKRDKYILAAFVISLLLQCWLVARITSMQTKMQTVRHFAPGESWYVLNVVLAGAVLVAMAAVLRTGSWRQRLAALVLCICPLIFLYDLCRWCLAVISRP